MAVRSQQLYRGTLTLSGPATLFTVPADRTAIIRSLELSKPTTGVVTVTFDTHDATTTRTFEIVGLPTAAGSVYFERWIVLLPGQSVRAAMTSTLAPVDVHISGPLLFGAPS